MQCSRGNSCNQSLLQDHGTFLITCFISSSRVIIFSHFLLLLIEVVASIVGCPPLQSPPIWDIEDKGALPYLTVHSQAVADSLATCETFTGDLFVTGSNASAPLMIPGPIHINGSLQMLLSPFNGTTVTMSSLVSVPGPIWINQGRFFKQVTTISFPFLEHTTQEFRVEYLPALTTLDLPRLSHAKSLDLYHLPALHSLSVPALTTLPALQKLTFPAPLTSGLFSFGPRINIRNTSLSQITDLSFASATSIEISSNKNLQYLTLPSQALTSTPYDIGRSAHCR